MTDLHAHVLAHPPRCLASVQALPIPPLEQRGEDSVAFRLVSPAGEEFARVLGHRLSALNPNYAGEEFVSPLLLSFAGDTLPALIFDSNTHGYHGEMDSAAKLRGSGPPETFACPGCAGERFVVSVQFDYGGGCHDLAEDEPDLPIQNYFQDLLVRGQCERCGLVSDVLDMDL